MHHASRRSALDPFSISPGQSRTSEAVATTQYPLRLSPTIVNKCVVVSDSRRLSEGMERPSDSSLSDTTAFRTLAGLVSFYDSSEMGAGLP